MYFGLRVKPELKNFYAWTPSYQNVIPAWIDDCFPNAQVEDSFIVYTKDPMRKFVMKSSDVIVRCTLGSVVFFAIISKPMFENWWSYTITTPDDFGDVYTMNTDKELSSEIFEK